MHSKEISLSDKNTCMMLSHIIIGGSNQLRHTVTRSSQDFQTGAQPSNQQHGRGGGRSEVWKPVSLDTADITGEIKWLVVHPFFSKINIQYSIQWSYQNIIPLKSQYDTQWTFRLATKYFLDMYPMNEDA